MQKQICNYLNRPFPLFLALRKGRIYFIWMIFILVVLCNILQPFGFSNIHEFHKGMVLTDYILLFFGVYALLYMTLSYFRREHYNPDTWTLRKELQVLFIFFPSITCVSCLYASFSVPEFDLTFDTFFDIQLYNCMLGVVSIPGFGYFISTKLQPTETSPTAKRSENAAGLPITKLTGNPDEDEQARKVIQHLHEVMITEQLYLSNKCTLLLVSEHTGIPVHRISGTINHYTEYTFTDFVNKYRVEHVCRILQQGKNKCLKLEAIGLECGFGSKVNFYNSFKKFMGKTPAEYLKGK
ncbi:MAG: helix-turn-helix domain-containing protein [Paludibacter sp.]|nr:helix-turn-helix domain-containing protein [Paludibacter sp.]